MSCGYLHKIARTLGVSYKRIKTLNPSYKGRVAVVVKGCGNPKGSMLSANSDIWSLIWEAELHQQPQQLHQKQQDILENVRVTKVKGHSTQEDVDKGLLTIEEAIGNSFADMAARAGAHWAKLPHHEVSHIQEIDNMAWLVQARIIAVAIRCMESHTTRPKSRSIEVAQEEVPQEEPEVATPLLLRHHFRTQGPGHVCNYCRMYSSKKDIEQHLDAPLQPERWPSWA